MQIVRTATLALLSSASIFAADSGLVNLVMPEARLVAGADLQRAKASSFGRYIMKQIEKQSAGDFENMVTAFGFDPRRDLHEVIFASVDPQPGKSQNAVVGVRGAFDVQRISTFFKNMGKEDAITNYQGVDILAPDSNGVAFLDSSVAVLGEPAAVKNAIDRRRSGRKVTETTAASIRDVSSRNDIWFVSTTPFAEAGKPGAASAPPAAGPMAGMMNNDAFKAIDQVLGGIKLDAENITFSLEAVARSEKDASAMADVVRLIAGMIQMSRDRPETAAAAAMADALQLKTDGPRFRLSITMPQAEIEKLLDSQQKTPAPRAALR